MAMLLIFCEYVFHGVTPNKFAHSSWTLPSRPNALYHEFTIHYIMNQTCIPINHTMVLYTIGHVMDVTYVDRFCCNLAVIWRDFCPRICHGYMRNIYSWIYTIQPFWKYLNVLIESVYFYVCIKKRLCIQTTHTALISRCFLCAVFLLRGFLEYLQRSRAIKAKCIMNERKTYLPTVMASVQTLMSKLRSLQWRYNGHDGISNYHPYHCLLNRLFSGRTSKLRVTGLCEENSPVTGEFPTQRASNTENISIGWRHHVITDVIANLRYYC